MLGILAIITVFTAGVCIALLWLLIYVITFPIFIILTIIEAFNDIKTEM